MFDKIEIIDKCKGEPLHTKLIRIELTRLRGLRLSEPLLW